MKFTAHNRTVRVHKSFAVFNFKYSINAAGVSSNPFDASMIVQVESEQGFDGVQNYSARITILAETGGVEGEVYQYAATHRCAEDLSVAMNLGQSAAAIGHLVLAHSSKFCDSVRGRPLDASGVSVESAVWQGFTDELQTLEFSSKKPFPARI